MRPVASVVVVCVFCCAFCCAACAGVGEAVIGSCLAATLQVGAEICVDAVCGAVCDSACDGDGDVVPDSDDAVEERPEIPPNERAASEADASAVCRLQLDEGGALRLGCVDGTSALALGDEDAARSFVDAGVRTVDGDVVIDDAADVAALANVFAIGGSLRVESAVLLRVRLPSLRSVGGDIVVVRNPRLVRLELPAVAQVGGAVVIDGNAALSADPLPSVSRADRVDVVDNDALPPAVVDRLLALPN